MHGFYGIPEPQFPRHGRSFKRDGTELFRGLSEEEEEIAFIAKFL